MLKTYHSSLEDMCKAVWIIVNPLHVIWTSLTYTFYKKI